MRLEYFEYLMALSEHSSMSAASRSLHVTPQTLSIAIGKLEKELGVKLIVTNNHGTMLNENGLFLVEKTKTFFDAIGLLRQQGTASQNATDVLPVHVLADEWIKEDFAAQLLCAFRKNERFADTVLSYCKTADFFEVFLNGVYDVGLFYNVVARGKDAYAIAEGVSFVPFWRSDLYCVLHRDHPLAVRQSVSLKTLFQSDTPFVVDRFGKDFLPILEEFAPLPAIDWEDNLIAVQKLIGNNLAFGMDYLSFDGTPVRGLPPECVVVKINDPLYGVLGYALKADIPPSAGTRAFLDYLLSDIAHVV